MTPQSRRPHHFEDQRRALMPLAQDGRWNTANDWRYVVAGIAAGVISMLFLLWWQA